MARSRSKTSSRSQSRKSTAAASDIEVVEEEGGMGIEDGIVLMTAIVLVVAIILVAMNLGQNFGEGMFFK